MNTILLRLETKRIGYFHNDYSVRKGVLMTMGITHLEKKLSYKGFLHNDSEDKMDKINNKFKNIKLGILGKK